MIPLSRWLVVHDAPRALCWHAGIEMRTDAFVADVAALAQVLEQRGNGRWIVCTESAYACAVGLFALWQSGSTAVMPPNLEAGRLRELSSDARGVLTDCDLPSIGLESVRMFGWPAAKSRAWRELDCERTLLELCTSGSSGARKIVSKTLDQLESETLALEGEFGARCGDSRVIGTVSFQHIYGLLFRVLWPLCAGRVFADQSIVDPAQIAKTLETLGRGILVSSPAHLKRLPELLDLARLRPTCVEIFSSGGALDESTASRFEEQLGFAPSEVLGSTETGGIAWRRQDRRDDAQVWTPFPGARIEARAGLLHVHSAPAGAQGGVTTGDAIELQADGRFQLLGRADRVVKLFDERLSLVEVESRLCAHPWVKSAAALTLERNGTPRIAVAIVLGEAGAQVLRESGKPAVIAALQPHLRSYFRATALPRAWRFVERLPEDAQGKTSVQALEALFADGSPPRSARLVQRATVSAGELEIELEVPRDLLFLRGHFDDLPVVAGVVQLQWVIEWAGEWLGAVLLVRGVEALKFKQLLCAGDRFRLRLERTNGAEKLRFKLWNERGEFSSGRLLFSMGGA